MVRSARGWLRQGIDSLEETHSVTHWHQRTIDDCLQELDSNAATGLTEQQARARRLRYGLNEIVETGGRGPLRILWEQLSGAMVVLLIVAAAVSIYLNEMVDAGVIVAIVVLNAMLGFFQDYRAERALAALKKLSVPTVRVRRDGVVREMSARELVPGDIVLLEVGNYAPADARLLEAFNFKFQESALTGESEPVEKQIEPCSGDDLPLGDRSNMVFMGTIAAYGHGLAVITATGMDTELGHIARLAADHGNRANASPATTGPAGTDVGPCRDLHRGHGVCGGADPR